MKLLKIIWLLVLISTISIYAQEERAKYGIFTTFNVNHHSVDFKKLPDCPSCSPGYDVGDGSGFTFGALYEYPIKSWLSAGLRAEYFNYSADLKKDELKYQSNNGAISQVSIEHSIEAKLASIGISPNVSMKLYNALNFNIGAHIGYVVKKSYSQYERLSSGTYLDSNGIDTHSNERNILSGDIPQSKNINFSGFAGLSYDIIFGKNVDLIFSPMVEFSYNFIPVAKNYEVNKWDVNSIKGGIALKYSPKFVPEKIDKYEYKSTIDTIRVIADNVNTAEIRTGAARKTNSVAEDEKFRIITENTIRTDTLLIPKKYKLSGDLAVLGVEADGTEVVNPTFTITEYISNKTQVIINNIFFDENSAKLPNKYIQISSESAKTFAIGSLYNLETMPTYYQILNIIGKRLQDNEKAKITIIGCNSDFGAEKGNKELSKERAMSVANYLSEVWGIEKNRLKIEARNLPSQASMPIDEKVKMEENRRVEFASDNDDILSPAILSDTLRTANPPIARFKISANSEAGLETWNLKAKQNVDNQMLLLDTLGSAQAPKILDWNLSLNGASIPKKLGPVESSLTLKDKKGNIFTSSKIEMPVNLISISKKREDKIADKQINKYRLIVFKIGKSEIEANQQKNINFIKKQLSPESNVIINGYGDITGSEEINMEISERRSQAVKKALGVNAKTVGLGKSELLFDNNTPEGRFYSRTVEVIIESPIKY